ncbi:MAG: DUF4870 family protein [bacterium]|jgi:uncharacterized membrane protein|nr:hypothetical protein [Betaproteobacteria bacterium]
MLPETMNAPVTASVEPDPSLVTLTHVVYGLHALSLVIGAFGAATIIGAFLFGWPSIIAVVISYVKRGEAAGTWLESHFRWQIRTFWYAVLWATLVVLVSVPLTLVLVGFVTWALGLFALGIWATYRIVRGWLALNDRKALQS